MAAPAGSTATFRGPAACRNPGPLYDLGLASVPGVSMLRPTARPSRNPSTSPGGIRASRPGTSRLPPAPRPAISFTARG